MKHLFVPYEIAVMAKEAGFNEPCLAFYKNITADENSPVMEIQGLKWYDNNNARLSRLFDEECTAPLYQQLTDWFFSEHKILIRKSYSGAEITTYTSPDSTTEFESLDAALIEAFKLIK